MSQPRDWRSNHFDLLRFALASLVIVSHSFMLVQPDQTHFEPLHAYSRGQASVGSLAVHAFFIISGYLITLSWWRSRSAGDFALKRALRLLPAFLLLQAVTILLITPAFAQDPGRLLTPGEWFNMAALVGTLNGYGLTGTWAHEGAYNWNWSLWTLQYEAWCYAGLALLSATGVLASRWRALAALGVAMGVAAWSELSATHVDLGVFSAFIGTAVSWSWLAPAFLCGVCFYFWRDAIPLRGDLAIAAAVLYLVACRVPHAVHLVGLPLLAYVVFCLAYLPRVSTAGFSRYGDFSYGIYLWGMPAQHVVVLMLGPSASPWLISLAAWPIAVACGAASCHLVEKHAARLKPGRPTHVPAIETPAGLPAAPEPAAPYLPRAA